MEVNGYRQLLLQTFFKVSSCFAQQKKESHTGLEQLEGEQIITEFSFFW